MTNLTLGDCLKTGDGYNGRIFKAEPPFGEERISIYRVTRKAGDRIDVQGKRWAGGFVQEYNIPVEERQGDEMMSDKELFEYIQAVHSETFV